VPYNARAPFAVSIIVLAHAHACIIILFQIISHILLCVCLGGHYLVAIAQSSASVRRTSLKIIVTVAHERIHSYDLPMRSENGKRELIFDDISAP
jgi:hypothetical protein